MIFWIIDMARQMSPIPAANKEAAMEKYNDKHQVRADYCIPADIAPSGLPYMPLLPDWMCYTLAPGVKAESNKRLEYKPNEHGELEAHQEVFGTDHTQYFQHRKNALV